MPKRTEKTRLTREAWLGQALDILAREGEAKLRVDRLAGLMGVTKGSFYWHFRNRQEFVESVARHWAETTTANVVETLANSETGPREKLRRLMEMVFRENLTRYDLAMRTWATHEPGVATVVRAVDRTRLRTVEDLFAELGFTGTELSARTRIFVCYMGLELALFGREPRKRLLAALSDRLDFFTRR